MDLEKLLREKPFELLNQDERNLVLEEMTVQEYAGMRRAALQAEKYFRKNLPPKPRPEIQARVREQMRYNQEKTLGGRIMRLIQYKIPALSSGSCSGPTYDRYDVFRPGTFFTFS